MKIILTGRPGVGKTTIIRKVIEILKEKAIGFWTEEFRDLKTNTRQGFKVVTTDGKTCNLAAKDLKSPHRVGSYGVNVKEFESLVIPLLEKAIKLKDHIIVVDEIGKMELFSEKFVDLIRKIIFNSNYNIIATIPIKDVHPLVASIRQLKDINLIEITQDNRDRICENLLSFYLKNYLVAQGRE